ILRIHRPQRTRDLDRPDEHSETAVLRCLARRAAVDLARFGRCGAFVRRRKQPRRAPCCRRNDLTVWRKLAIRIAPDTRPGRLGRISGRTTCIRRELEMNFSVARRAAFIAAIGISIPVVYAGVAGGFATEWTQLANNLQLVNSYIRLGDQLQQEIKMVLDMT